MDSSDLYGSVIDDRIIPEIGYLVYRECTPNWIIKQTLKTFNYWDITYVTQGRARYTIDGINYDLTTGDLLCSPPGITREAKTWPDNLMHCFAVNFSLKSFEEGKPAVLPMPLVSHIGYREDIIQLFNELVFTWINPQPLYTFKVRALFMLILHRFMETALYNINSTVNDSRIQKVLRFIATHYPEKITVKDMANLCNLDSIYFGALFKRETGMTLLKYLAKTRIKYAENFLKSGEFRVNEVAARCGYSDIYHFYSHFKDICGVAPSSCIPRKIKH
ncbi:MAG: AraC family transcriptional regulator [Treponema sp.]|nr:AraC family transcriptional regulator [Treponema sp.]